MNLSAFDTAAFNQLLQGIGKRSIFFGNKGPGILLRHDVDDDLPRSVAMAKAEAAAGVKATYFILNTASYWPSCWDSLKAIQEMGHEIAWHNNVITEWITCGKQKTLDSLITSVLLEFMGHGFEVRGSASHGDRMCYEYNYVNYQAFSDYPKNGLNGAPAKIDFDQVQMQDYGLEYEAYSVGQNVYVSESGRSWRGEVKESDLRNPTNRMQILIHPQHWRL